MMPPVNFQATTRSSQVANVQRALTAGWVLWVVGWAVWWRADPVVVWGGVGSMLVQHGLLLAFQFGLSVRISRAAGHAVPSGWVLVGAWWRESVIAVKVFGWRQPWRWRARPDTLPTQPVAPQSVTSPGATVGIRPRGVLLVHGFMCNRGIWNGWHAELAQGGHPVVAVNLEPCLGTIDDYVATIEQAVAALTHATGRPPLVVAHSMGGLAMRAWLRATPGAQARVAHIVTLGTPHQGTWLARWGLATNARQMRLNSPWLRELAASEPPDLGRLFTCWHSCADNIVFPLGTAVLPGCTERYLPSVGHVALVDHPLVRAGTLAQLAR